MNCAKVEELSSEYITGMLPAPLEQAVRTHVQSCPACAADLETLKRVWTGLDALPAVEPPLFFHENVMSAIERQAVLPSRLSGWRMLLPQLGRVAASTLATGLAVAALGWTLLLPTLSGTEEYAAQQANPGVLTVPRTADEDSLGTTAAVPRLKIERITVVNPEVGPSYQFMIRLEGASRGTARLHLLPDNALSAKTVPVQRLILRTDVPAPPLVVPFTAVEGKSINLFASWTANGVVRTTYLFVPIPRNDALPPERQSFGLPVGTLPEIAREVAVRYGQPVILEDTANKRMLSLTAVEQTATEALRRALRGQGVQVLPSAQGIFVRPAAAAPPVLR